MHRAYKKALIDFEDETDPDQALLEYSDLAGLENQVARYIGTVIEKKLVSRIKWEAEGFLKEIENSTVRKIALLQQNSQDAAKNIQNGTAFLETHLPRIKDRLKSDMKDKRYEYLQRFGVIIDKCTQKFLLKDISDVVIRSYYAAFFHLEQNEPWPEAVRKAGRVNIHQYSIFRVEDNLYTFKTQNQDLSSDHLLGRVESFIMENLRDRRLKTINAYKLGLKKVYEELLNDLGKLYSTAYNRLNKDLSKAMNWDEGQPGIYEFDGINLPLFTIDIPESCIELTEVRKKISVPNGYKTQKVKKVRQGKRAWYNPLSWIGFGRYQDEYEETEKKALFKTHTEKEITFTLNPVDMCTKLTSDVEKSAADWRENDLTSIYLSMDKMTRQYLQFFEQLHLAKQMEIAEMQSTITDAQKHLVRVKTDFFTLKKELEAAV